MPDTDRGLAERVRVTQPSGRVFDVLSDLTATDVQACLASPPRQQGSPLLALRAGKQGFFL